jgi:hypothetical protein
MTNMQRKLTVPSFIKRANKLKSSNYKYSHPAAQNSICVTLSDARMAKLEGILTGFGYNRDSKGIRQYVSASFGLFVDTL